MPLPNGFRIVESNENYFEVPDQYGQMKMFAFSPDKNRISTVTVDGTGLTKWGFDTKELEKVYKKPENADLVGIAVFDKGNLVGVVVGEVSVSDSNAGRRKTVQFNHVVHNDGTIEEITGDKPVHKLTGDTKFTMYPKDRDEVIQVTKDYTMRHYVEEAKKEYAQAIQNDGVVSLSVAGVNSSRGGGKER